MMAKVSSFFYYPYYNFCTLFVLLVLASHYDVVLSESSSRIRGNNSNKKDDVPSTRLLLLKTTSSSSCDHVCPFNGGDGLTTYIMIHLQEQAASSSNNNSCRERCVRASTANFSFNLGWQCGPCTLSTTTTTTASSSSTDSPNNSDATTTPVVITPILPTTTTTTTTVPPTNAVSSSSPSSSSSTDSPNNSDATTTPVVITPILPTTTTTTTTVPPTNTVSSSSPPSNGPITHQGSTSTWSATGQNMKVVRPSQSQPGDLLLLFLSRTDDCLPLWLEAWTTGPTCLKTDDFQTTCHVAADCTQWNDSGDYCFEFGGNPSLNGLDLGTGVFYRTVQATNEEPMQYTFNLQCYHATSCKPAWAILTAFRGVDNHNNNNPIVDSATMSMDQMPESKFPSVNNGSPGDWLLLSMAFDDGKSLGIDETRFLPPEGTTRLNYVIGNDEAGFVFAQELTEEGATGQKYTTGPGATGSGARFMVKDATISLIVRKQL